MTRRTRRWLLILVALVVSYVGSYALLSWQGQMFIGAGVDPDTVGGGFSHTIVFVWQPYGVRANPTNTTIGPYAPASEEAEKAAIGPGGRNWLGWLYAPLLPLDRWWWHNGL